jgi:hypothetical protein
MVCAQRYAGIAAVLEERAAIADRAVLAKLVTDLGGAFDEFAVAAEAVRQTSW